MPQVAHSAPAKPKEIRFSELLHNTLLSHTDPAQNCLTFSDISMLPCPSESACGICNNHSKETHAEILPKTTVYPHQLLSPSLYLGCSPVLSLPFTCCHAAAWVPSMKQTKDAYSYTNNMTLEK